MKHSRAAFNDFIGLLLMAAILLFAAPSSAQQFWKPNQLPVASGGSSSSGSPYIDPTQAPYNVVCDGVQDNTVGLRAAMTAAAAAAKVLIAPHNCLIGDLTIPADGVRVTAFTESPDYEFANAGTVWHVKSGATYGINVNGKKYVALSGFTIRGPGLSSGSTYLIGGNGALDMFQMSLMYGHRPVFGAGGNLFIRAMFTNFAQNDIGPGGQLPDFNSVGNTYAGNKGNGIDLNGLASASKFVGDRFEFNEGHNMAISSATDVTMDGVQFDRAYGCGIYLDGNWANITQTGGWMRRNGRLNTAGNNADYCFSSTGSEFGKHFYASNVIHTHGVDDGGGGPDTPAYVIYWGGSGSNNFDVNLVGGNLADGYVTGIENTLGSYIRNYNINGLIPTTAGNNFFNRDMDGFYYAKTEYITITGGTTTGWNIVNNPTTASTGQGGDFSQYAPNHQRKLAFGCRGTDEDPQGAIFDVYWEWPFAGANATLARTSSYGTGGKINSGTGALAVSITAVSVDATQFTVSVNNTSGQDYQCNIRYTPE